MKFEEYVAQLARAMAVENGTAMAEWLSLDGEHVLRVRKGLTSRTRQRLNAMYLGKFAAPWDEVCIAYMLVNVNLEDSNPYAAYTEQATLVNAFLRAFIASTGWLLPPLYQILRDLRYLAEQADLRLEEEGKAATCCEDAARLCNKAFTSSVTDRTSKPEVSRKWGIYYTVGLVFKCYFKVGRINLCKNVIRAIDANHADIPPITAFPLAHQVTYRYYIGILAFLNEDYVKAETELSFAHDHCHHASPGNQERTLTFLVPLRLFLKGQRPSQTLLAQYPAIQELYGPFMAAMEKGDVVGFDEALQASEARLVQINVWLILIRLREVAVRGVLRKVWKTLGCSSRVTIQQFLTGLKIAGQDIDSDEAECLVANSIYKGFMKGYISHELQTVVLAKTSPFPRMADRVLPIGMQ